jgi:hypothetical protein
LITVTASARGVGMHVHSIKVVMDFQYHLRVRIWRCFAICMRSAMTGRNSFVACSICRTHSACIWLRWCTSLMLLPSQARRFTRSARWGVACRIGPYCVQSLCLTSSVSFDHCICMLFLPQLALEQRDPLQSRTRRQTYNETLLLDPSQRNSSVPALHDYSLQAILSANMARNESAMYSNMQPVWLVRSLSYR